MVLPPHEGAYAGVPDQLLTSNLTIRQREQ
jgi:hypothetical protein